MMIRLNQPEDIKKTSELCPDTASRRKKNWRNNKRPFSLCFQWFCSIRSVFFFFEEDKVLIGSTIDLICSRSSFLFLIIHFWFSAMCVQFAIILFHLYSLFFMASSQNCFSNFLYRIWIELYVKFFL